MLTDTDLIRKLDFFEPLDHKIVKNIAKMCIVREFQPGDYIIKQGESGLGLYFIVEGRAKVEIERGGIRIPVAELQGGDFIGELAMIDDKVRSADVTCTEETRCLLLTRDCFSKLLNKYPEISLQIAKSLVARIRATNERLGSSPQPATAPAPSPVAASLPVAPAPVPESVAEVTSSNGKADENGSLGSFLKIFSADNLPKIDFSSIKAEDINPLKVYSSTKSKTKDFLVDLFKPIYLMKEMTKFSMAIVGCPVTVQPQKRRPEVRDAVIEGVKLVVFPASEDEVLTIDAFDNGTYSATVFRPGSPSATHFEGKLCNRDIFHLHIPAAEREAEVTMVGPSASSDRQSSSAPALHTSVSQARQ